MIRGTSASGQVGPDLTHFGTRTSVAAGWLENTKENLGHWIMNPNEVKPGNIMYKTGYLQLDENGEEVQNYKIKLDDAAKNTIVDYLTSLE